MTVIATLFEHQDFGGVANTFSTPAGERYRGVRLGQLANEVTSLRATSSGGKDGNVYGFTNRDFDGRFASLNMPEGWTCWWSNVGSLNDDIESALLVNRDKEEASLDAGFWLANAFATKLDEKLAGKPVRRDSDLIIDDYHSYIAYDIALNLQSITRMRAEVAWVTTWVESGLFTDDVFDQLSGEAMGAVGDLNQALGALGDLTEVIAAFRKRFFSQPYLLPGMLPNMPPPDANFGAMGDSNDGATIVLPLLSPYSAVVDADRASWRVSHGP